MTDPLGGANPRSKRGRRLGALITSVAAVLVTTPMTLLAIPAVANGSVAPASAERTASDSAMSAVSASTVVPAGWSEVNARGSRRTAPSVSTKSARKVPLVGKSKMAWNSLVFGHGTAPASFETWRKRPVDGVLYFPARYSWSDLGQLPSRRVGDLMVYSIPPFPTGIGGSTAKVVAGSYDADITALAAKMKNAGWNTSRTVIRLGWESNGNWYQWSWDKDGPAKFAAAYQRFVRLSRAAGLTDVAWDWSLNKGPQAYNSGYSWTAGYPGDSYVDVIGIDPYDMWNPTYTDAQWQANIVGKNPGLKDVADFARAHGKQMAIDEWGVVHNEGGGGDNPFYVSKLFHWAQGNADVMAWDTTYDDAGAPSTWNHKLSDGSNPQAAAQYRKVYPAGWGG